MKINFIVSLMLLFALSCSISNKKENSILFPDMGSNCFFDGLTIERISQADHVNIEGSNFYKIKLYPWDAVMSEHDTCFQIINGLLYGDTHNVYIIDSSSNVRSLIFSFDSLNFKSEITLTKSIIKNGDIERKIIKFRIELREPFTSRRYRTVVYPFIVHDISAHYKMENLTFFVSPERGILGITSSILNNNTIGPSEIIYTYTGDPFPYWYYKFEKIIFQDKWIIM